MRLTCPQCHTEYEVPDAALAGRARTLRCADCGVKFQAPALPEPPAEPDPQPATADTDHTETRSEIPAEIIETVPDPVVTVTPPGLSRPAAPAPAPPNRALRISVLIVLLFIAVILAEHRAISHAWPPSLRLFNALGLH